MEPEPAEEAEPPTDATETEKRRGGSSKDAHIPAPARCRSRGRPVRCGDGLLTARCPLPGVRGSPT